jgi:hypothetical protein
MSFSMLAYSVSTSGSLVKVQGRMEKSKGNVLYYIYHAMPCHVSHMRMHLYPSTSIRPCSAPHYPLHS